MIGGLRQPDAAPACHGARLEESAGSSVAHGDGDHAAQTRDGRRRVTASAAAGPLIASRRAAVAELTEVIAAPAGHSTGAIEDTAMEPGDPSLSSFIQEGGDSR